MLDAAAPDARVIGVDMKRLMPVGGAPTQAAVIVTEEAKPFNDVNVIGTLTVCPCGTVAEVVAVTEKSCAAEVVVTADATTVSTEEAESPAGLPVAVILYGADATLLTIKEPLRVPAEIEQDELVTGVPDREQLVSLEEKLVPDTWTLAPAAADVAFSVMVGEELRIVK